MKIVYGRFYIFAKNFAKNFATYCAADRARPYKPEAAKPQVRHAFALKILKLFPVPGFQYEATSAAQDKLYMATAR